MKNIWSCLVRAFAETSPLEKMRTWIAVQQLQHQIRVSRRFQRYCEKIGCPILAELEKNHQEKLKRRISHPALFIRTPQQ